MTRILTAVRESVVSAAALYLLCIHLFTPAFGQESDTLRIPYWENDLGFKVNASQAGYRNWTEGGANSISTTTTLAGTFERTSSNWRQIYESRLGIGFVKQENLDFRKAEDVIRFKGQVSYRGNGLFRKFNPTAAASVRTQFAPGYNYDANPFDDARLPPVKVSDFLTPATFTQSLGLSYTAEWGFKQRLGMAAKETLVMLQFYRTLYGLSTSQAVRFQLGVESQTEIDREVFKNVKYKTTLGLFAAFNQEELPDVLWENMIIMKVNSWLSADFEFVTLYDRDIGDVLQIKEVVSIGISVLII